MAAVKALQQWCRVQCGGYRDVSITNMTTSFRDGMAFCALIHKHRPDLIDFDSLKKDDVYENNQLAFSVAETQLGIPALLDAEDMVALKVPDRLSILTYVSQYYNFFHGRSPIGGMGGISAPKRPAEGNSDEPSGKKNQPVTAKVFPGSKPASENIPPPSWNVSRPSPAQRPTPNVLQETPAKKNHSTGTLSNKCASCNGHVHLVQRHLVDGKLYHRQCAKTQSLSGSPLRDLLKNTPPPTAAPRSDPVANPPVKPSRLWNAPQPDPARTPPHTASSSPPAKVSPLASVSNGSRTGLGKAETTSTPAFSTRTTPASRTSTTADVTLQAKLAFFQTDEKKLERETEPEPRATRKVELNKNSVATKPEPSPQSSVTTKLVLSKGQLNGASHVTSKPEPSPRTSKPEQNKGLLVTNKPEPLERVTTKPSGTAFHRPTKPELNVGSHATTKPEPIKVSLQISKPENKTSHVTNKVLEARVNHPVVLSVAVAVPESTSKETLTVGEKDKDEKKKAAAAFLCKKFTEEKSKPEWATVGLKKTEKPPPQVVTPKSEPVRGRVKLKVNPGLLSDLQSDLNAQNAAPTPTIRTELRPSTPERPRAPARPTTPERPRLSDRPNTPDREAPRTSHTTPSSDGESPADWRSRLKPLPRDSNSRPAASPCSSPKPGRAAPHPPPHISVSSPAKNVQKDQTAANQAAASAVAKMNPSYIPKEEILRELQEIEDNLNELERDGVELEKRLRTSEEEGAEDSLMDDLMVQWFTLIQNKQVAMRRESELVYIGRTQELEEQQPSVEKELRRLMEKPDHLKNSWDRRREEQLLAKLMEIVDDRNAIVDGLDDDRLREGEEDEQLNQMMRTFSFKKKPKKKSPISRFFSWGAKKEG